MLRNNWKQVKRDISFLIFILFTLNITNMQAQKLWSLEDCIQYAIENNIQIKRQELNAKMAKNNYIQSKIQVLPSISASGNHTVSQGRAVNYEDYSYVDIQQQYGSVNLSGYMYFFNGLQGYNSIKQNKFNLKASLEDLEKSKNDIRLNIATAYLQILFNEELLEIAKNQLEVTKQQVERTQLQVEVGKVQRGRLLEMQAQAAQEKFNVTSYNNQLKISYLTLTQILDLDSVGNFKIQHPELPEIDKAKVLLPVNIIYFEAQAHLPQIKSAEYNLKSSEKGLALVRGQRIPRISIGAGTYSRYSDLAINPRNPQTDYLYTDQIKDNRNTGVQFSLNFPIFDGYRTQTNISNSKISVLDAKLALDQARQQLYQEIQQAHANAFAALDNYKSSHEAILFMEEAFNYTQKQFDVGLVSSVDYNIAKNNLTSAQSNLLQAKYDYIFKTKILDFYLGKPIVL